MRILWYSATPECHSGYGNASRNMISWLTKQGHWVAAATKHPVAIRWRMWDVPGADKQIPIMSGTNIDLVNNDAIIPWKLDCCISMFDVWGLKKPIAKHIPWIPIDTQNVSEKIVEKVKDTPMQIAMSKHGWGELFSAGLEPRYAPIGFDPEVFHPMPEKAREFRDAMIWPDGLKGDEMFLIGSVGLNYADDRKGFITLMQAFKGFHKKHPEARLFIHTQPCKKSEGMDYARAAQELGIMDYVGWPDPAMFWLGQYAQEDIAGLYSAFDVFCLPTKGEGFGMPTVEAQACGTPVCVTDNTTGVELTRSGFVIRTDPDDYVYTGLNTWRVPPRPSRVAEALESVYHLSRSGLMIHPEQLSAKVAEYSWPNVWENHWQPIITEIEGMLPLPDITEGE
jgi:glycosyltransferase involved in cell wall biosynthesis